MHPQLFDAESIIGQATGLSNLSKELRLVLLLHATAEASLLFSFRLRPLNRIPIRRGHDARFRSGPDRFGLLRGDACVSHFGTEHGDACGSFVQNSKIRGNASVSQIESNRILCQHLSGQIQLKRKRRNNPGVIPCWTFSGVSNGDCPHRWGGTVFRFAKQQDYVHPLCMSFVSQLLTQLGIQHATKIEVVVWSSTPAAAHRSALAQSAHATHSMALPGEYIIFK